jgi:hypothetical protein
MQTNESVWQYYNPGYVHPDFQPYVRTKVPLKDETGRTATSFKPNYSKDTDNNNGNDEVCYVEMNPWKRQGCATGLTNPYLVRKGWNMSFQLKHASYPCPAGFEKTQDGWCYAIEPEYEPVFYTNKAFIPQNQFWDGYVDNSKYRKAISDTFDMRSINPSTGKYTVYYHSHEDPKQTLYGKYETSDSYL